MRTFEALSIFLLLISSPVFLVHGGPIPESTLPISDDVGSTKISTTSPLTTSTTTAAPPTPKGEEMSKVPPNENEEDPLSDSRRDGEPKQKSARLLLYEVEKGIRNLSLQDIEYVLGLGDEVFSYSLADRLGYLKSGKDNDPHVKAIDDNQKTFIKMLEDMKKELKPVIKVPPPLSTTVPPPPPPETPSPPSERWIKYDIVRKIMKLTLADIDLMIGSYDMKTLPYALGVQLGYDEERDAEYFQYLVSQGGENLKRILLNEKKKKPAEPRPKPPQHTQPQSSRGDDEGDGSPDGGEAKTKTPEESRLQTSKGDTNLNWSPAGEGEGTRRKEEEADKEGKEREKGGPGGDHSSSPLDTGDNHQHRNDNRPSLSQDEHKNNFEEGDGDKGHPPFVDDDNSEDTFNKGDDLTGGENQSNANEGDVNNENVSQEGNGREGGDKEGTKTVLEGAPEKEKDSDAGLEDGDNRNAPADSGNAEGDGGKEADPEEEEEEEEEEEGHENEKEGEELEDKNKESLTVSSGLPSVFGAWHFLTIFLFIGVAVIAGYLCLHNRQKLKDVRTYYISDSNKHWRRYKPLIST